LSLDGGGQLDIDQLHSPGCAELNRGCSHLAKLTDEEPQTGFMHVVTGKRGV